VPLLTQEGKAEAGNVKMSARLLSLVSEEAKATNSAPSVGYLSCKILKIVGLSAGAQYPFRVKIRVLYAQDAPQEVKHKITKQLSSQSQTSSFNSNAMVEGQTQASVPKPQKQLAEALQSICKALSKLHSLADIADILNVEERQVDEFLHPEKSTQTMKQVQAATNPTFDEVVQLLLPEIEKNGTVQLEVVNKQSKSLGTVDIPVHKILEGEHLCACGPFILTTGPEIIGSLSLKWLA